LFHLPEGTNPGYFFPYEDISSFGSVSVALLIYLVASFQAFRHRYAVWGVLGICAVLIMVVASWSRATWLAAAVFLLLAVFVRMPRRWAVFALVAVSFVVFYVNINRSNPTWQHSPYLSRLSALALIENPANKSPSRLDLYHKAFGMIMARPIVGFGIGSFYLVSREFARPGDPLANVSDFAHDVWLQLAAELGIPIAILCLGIFCWALKQGYRNSRGVIHSHWLELPRLGATLALASYLMTQVTANSLNVYESNQFICWFLVAVIARPSSNGREDSAQYLGALQRG
jgi:O-antigen ligase